MNTTANHQLDPARWNENHRDYLMHYALGKVRNPSIAEDVVQETFMAAWKARKGFQGKAAERTWLTRILLNKISDFYRSAARKPSLMVSQLGLEAEDSDTLDALNYAQNGDQGPAHEQPARAAENAEFVELVESALDRIPGQAAEAFRMRELQGLSTDDITTKLGISRNHLWVLIHRAKKALRDQLSAIWEPTGSMTPCPGC